MKTKKTGKSSGRRQRLFTVDEILQGYCLKFVIYEPVARPASCRADCAIPACNVLQAPAQIASNALLVLAAHPLAARCGGLESSCRLSTVKSNIMEL